MSFRALRPPFLYCLSLMVLLLFMGCARQAPRAQRGVMDLRGWDLGRESVHLDGEWECRWGSLVPPGDAEVGQGYLSLPGAWNGKRLGTLRLPGRGMATLRLRILLPPGTGPLGLKTFNIQSAYRVWINGVASGGSGRLGEHRGSELANPAIQYHLLPGGTQEAVILLQISNHHFHQGGVLASLELGEPWRLQALQARSWGRVLFFAGGLLMIGVYHLVIYWFRRDSLAPLLFGAYCLAWAGFMLVVQTHGMTLRLFLPEIPFTVLERAKQCFLFLSVPVGFGFFRELYPREISGRILRASVLIGLLQSVLALLLPTQALFPLLSSGYLPTFGFMFYCFYGLYRAHRGQREGATFILAGFLILGFTGLHDAAVALGWLPPGPWIQLGMMVFVLFQALVLSLRLSRAFTAVEHLSSVLDHKNQALRDEIQERARLEQEIVTVSEEERQAISHELHDGICQQITGALLRCRVVARNLKARGQDDSSVLAISELLDESLSQAHDIAKGLGSGVLKSGGLGAAMVELLRRTRETHELSCELEDDGSGVHLDELATNQLFWIARESLLNAIKHSDANQIWVRMRASGDFFIIDIENDGARPEPGRGAGMGLRIMHYRAGLAGGSIAFESPREGGWRVRCRVPMASSPVGEGLS